MVWDNGEKREEGIIKNGEQNGIWHFWNENAELIEARLYVKGVIISRTKNSYQSSNKSLLKEQKKFNYDDILLEHRIYGTPDTNKYMVTFYYENENKKSEGEIVNNKKIGEWSYFKNDGKLDDIYIYNGKESTLTKFWRNGEKKAEGNILNEEKIGLWNNWNNEGDLIEFKLYEEGVLLSRTTNEYYNHTIGLLYEQKTYNTQNILLEHRSYGFQENNKYNVVYYYENGIKKSSGKIVDGLNVGKWNYYNETGAIAQIEKHTATSTKTINVAKIERVILPTKNNSIIKIYRNKKNPPSKKLENGKSVNSTSYDLFINEENIVKIENGAYHEFEITSEGLYNIEATIDNTATINLFVKLGRTYFLKCELLKEGPNGNVKLTIVDPVIGIKETKEFN